MTRTTSGRTEDSPFFNPLPFGYQLVAEYLCTCDYDFYSTGDESRKNGCGDIYYRRISISPSGLMHNERTPCSCVIEYENRMQGQKEKEALNNRRGILTGEIDRLLKPWNLLYDDAHRHMYLEKYRAEDKTHQKALTTLKEFTPGQRGFCICGHQGRGKTHLAVGVARKAKAMGYTVLAIKSIDILNRLRRCYASKDDNAEVAIMRVLREVELLVIDDIGVEKPSGWVLEKFYEIIDYRFNRRSTIFTTNLDGENMEKKIGKALTSRVYGVGELKIGGRDWRVTQDLWSELGREIKR